MTAENVFKFVSLRPAERADSARVKLTFARYDDHAKSPLHLQIESLTGDNRRAQAIELAITYMVSDKYLCHDHPITQAVEQASVTDTVADARKTAAESLCVNDLAIYLQSDNVATLRDRIWDSLYAQVLAPNHQPDDRSQINTNVQALHYLFLLVEQDDEQTPMSLEELQQVTPIIPAGVVPPADPEDDTPDDTSVVDKAIQDLKLLHSRLLARSNAIGDLHNVERLHRRQLLSNPQEADSEPSVSDQAAPTAHDAKSATTAAEPTLNSYTVIKPPRKPWIFDAFGQNNLQETTKTLLANQQAAFEEQETAEIIAILEDEMYQETVAFLKALPIKAVPYIVARKEFRHLSDLVPVPLAAILPVQPAPEPAPGSPAARGIRPLGIGDLLVVQQNLLGYAPGEVAHIENVLKSEHKSRTHKRLRETEEILFIETEELEETERDLQSTERFELQKEAERTVESQMNIGAGLSVTASYGCVSATATANFAYNRSRSESNRVASQFAKEVIDRSVSRIMQRTREERTRRTLERFEEINEHGFDNSDGDGHVTGVYRWVDKYYTARTINYGRRLMIEFIVPEPAAFYIHTQNNRQLPGITSKRPDEPTIWGRRLRPEDLTRTNYQQFVSKYNVQDVNPYPSLTTKVSAALAEASSTDKEKNVTFGTSSEKLVIPPGYMATSLYGAFYCWGYTKDFHCDCLVAGKSFAVGIPTSVMVYGLEGTIPISVIGCLAAFHVNLVTQCELKEASKAKWQLETFEAIMNAYEQALADYNEEVASAEIAQGVDIQGRNPELNRKIERDELKKNALRVLTNEYARTRVDGNWRFQEQFNAMKPYGDYGYPELDVDEALVEGQIIQFFEQAFEWNNMTYRFYPYFWGRKENWKDTFLIDDTDPQFNDFLRAGAARVIVPVHPAYSEAILHYLYTNEIWNGDRPPTLDDPLYVSIIDELKSDTGADINKPLPSYTEESGYPCVIDEWTAKVPTSLVYLQPGSDLPGFDIVNKGVQEYIVKPGDSWWKIAQLFGVTVKELQQANPGSVRPGNIIYPGERFLIPAKP